MTARSDFDERCHKAAKKRKWTYELTWVAASSSTDVRMWWICDQGHNIQMSLEQVRVGKQCPECKKINKSLNIIQKLLKARW